MIQPPRSRKFRKFRKAPIVQKNVPNHSGRSLNASSFSLKYGNIGLVSLNAGRMSTIQLEAARRTITFALKRAGKLWIRAYPDIPVTSKPSDARMGKGKGNVSHWVAHLKTGQIILELVGVEERIAKVALLKGAKKLPFDTRVICRLQPKVTK